VNLKLDLRGNALHTLHHAIDHLRVAEGDLEQLTGRRYDSAAGTVEWQTPEGHTAFYLVEFAQPPATYNYKFSLLHLIQACELLMKAHLRDSLGVSIHTLRASAHTIGMRDCTKRIVAAYPDLLTPEQTALLLRAKDLRNELEHFEFDLPVLQVRALCNDLLAICALFTVRLFGFSLAALFSCDYWRDREDPVGSFIQSALANVTQPGETAKVDIACAWASLNPSDTLVLCLSCGARGASLARDVCVVCGADAEPEVAEALEDLGRIAEQIAAVRRPVDER
jgi:hypothetical protein